MGTADVQPLSSNEQGDYKPQGDYREIRNALRGLSCNEKRVMEVLGRRSQAQRTSIAEGYKQEYGESLQKRLKSALGGGKLAKCISLWSMEPSERDAVLLFEALREGGSNKDRAVIGLLCTRTAPQIYQIKQAYYSLFHRTLESHIDGSGFEASYEPSSNSKSKWAFWRSSEQKIKIPPKRALVVTKLLTALARGSRPTNSTVDRHIALQDAHQLNKVCTGKVGNEETLVRIFSTRSPIQLIATMNYYQQHYGYDFEKPLSKKDVGEFLQALQPVVQCLRQPSKFYAMELAAALPGGAGGGAADEESLIRVLTTRAETDMKSIKQEFANESKRSLEEAITSDLTGSNSGNLRHFLLTIINQGIMESNNSTSTLSSATPRSSNASSHYMSTQTSTGSASHRQQASDSSQNGSHSQASYFSGNSQNSF